MPHAYRKLALHNSVCNEVYFKLQDCENEHPVARFIGTCTQWNKELDKCIRANREHMRAKNRELAKERHGKQNYNKDSSNV